MRKEQIIKDAIHAVRFTVKGKTGGNKLTRKPTCYGVALKWLIYRKGITYAEFAKRYNGTTAQNANHLINRISEERYILDEIEKMCDALEIDIKYFERLVAEVKNLMEK